MNSLRALKGPSKVLIKEDLICKEDNPEVTVDRTLDKKVLKGWVEVDNLWNNNDETDNRSSCLMFKCLNFATHLIICISCLS